MRLIGQLSDEAQAHRFGDFLVTQGVHNEVDHDGNGRWSLWVHEENQVATAQSEFARFCADPNATEFRGAAAEAGRIRDTEAREAEEYHRRIRTRQNLFPASGGYRAAFVTYTLIAVCVAIGLLSKLGSDEAFLQYLAISKGYLSFLPEVRAGEVWRLFTPVLIHFGLLHLLFNMLWLFQLGSMIEGRQGHTCFVLLMIALAVGSNLAQYMFGGPAFGGMSGVVYGMFGYVWLRGRFDPGSGLFIDQQNIVLMMVWFVACFTGWIGPVANWAHVAGLVLGAGWGLFSGLLASGRRG
jgi:GlpG protein